MFNDDMKGIIRHGLSHIVTPYGFAGYIPTLLAKSFMLWFEPQALYSPFTPIYPHFSLILHVYSFLCILSGIISVFSIPLCIFIHFSPVFSMKIGFSPRFFRVFNSGNQFSRGFSTVILKLFRNPLFMRYDLFLMKIGIISAVSSFRRNFPKPILFSLPLAPPQKLRTSPVLSAIRPIFKKVATHEFLEIRLYGAKTGYLYMGNI